MLFAVMFVMFFPLLASMLDWLSSEDSEVLLMVLEAFDAHEMNTKKKDHENLEDRAAGTSVLLMVLSVLTMFAMSGRTIKFFIISKSFVVSSMFSMSSVSWRTIEFFIISKSFLVSSEFGGNVTLDWHASNNLHWLCRISLNSWSSVLVVFVVLVMLAMLAVFALSSVVAFSSESRSLFVFFFTLELEFFLTKSLWRWRWSFSLSVISSSSHSIKHLEETELFLLWCIKTAA